MLSHCAGPRGPKFFDRRWWEQLHKCLAGEFRDGPAGTISDVLKHFTRRRRAQVPRQAPRQATPGGNRVGCRLDRSVVGTNVSEDIAQIIRLIGPAGRLLSVYVELHASSAFSFLRAPSLPENPVERFAGLGYPALALLDRDGVADAPHFL